MNGNEHAIAKRLIGQERVEGRLPEADRIWLSRHLRDCDECARVAEETERALASLRNTAVDIPRGLASRTQMRVRLRADELQERGASEKFVWALIAVSWALGVASAPWVWRAFAWVGEHAGVPKPVWEAGVVLWWAVPAMFATGAILAARKGGVERRVD